jgi:hypothetical protein
MRARITALLAALVLMCTAAPAQKASLPFIDDDYPAALAQARTHNLPLFVEVWAPW